MKKVEISDELELIDIAKNVLQLTKDKNINVIFLIGDLGAGKTTFTKYLAKELGIKQNVVSPTFILHREYKMNDKSKLHHLDLYRIETEIELIELKLGEIAKNNLVIIEWADKFEEYLKTQFNNFLEVKISESNFNLSSRTINFKINL